MPPHERTTPSIPDLLRDLVAGQPRKAIAVILLASALPLLSGFSVALLIPVLARSNAVAADATSTSILNASDRLFALTGVTPTLNIALFVFLFAAVAHATLEVWQQRAGSRLKLNFVVGMQQRFYQSINQASWLFFFRTRHQDIAHALSIESDRVIRGLRSLLSLVSSATLVAVYLLFSAFLSIKITGLVILTCVCLGPWMVKYARSARQSGTNVSELTRKFYRDTIEHLGGIKESRCLGADSEHETQFRLVVGQLQDARLKFEDGKATLKFLVTFGTAIAVIGTIIVAIKLLAIPPVDLLLLILIYARLTPRILRAQSDYQDVVHALAAYGTLQAMHNDSQMDKESFVANNAGRLSKAPKICLSNVSFRYDQTTDIWALKDITAIIPSRSVTTIVGHSGAGKSTFADLLLGLLTAETGKIQTDRFDITSNLAGWRTSVGYVPQETFLLHDTLRRNLLWGNPDANDVDIRRALQLASVDDVVAALPDGLETVVGERGARLSGGERQRIAIARALLRNPSVLILDEATSALDAENSRRIQASLTKLAESITVIVIAHAQSAILNANHVIVLNDGCIAAQGSPADVDPAKNLLVA